MWRQYENPVSNSHAFKKKFCATIHFLYAFKIYVRYVLQYWKQNSDQNLRGKESLNRYFVSIVNSCFVQCEIAILAERHAISSIYAHTLSADFILGAGVTDILIVEHVTGKLFFSWSAPPNQKNPMELFIHESWRNIVETVHVQKIAVRH